MNGSYARDGENRSDNGRSSNDMSLASNNRSGICLKLIESLIVQEDTIVDAAD